MENKLILQDKSIKVKVFKNYMELFREGKSYVVSFMHIDEIYLYQDVKLSVKTCVELAKRVPVYIIDRYGYIVATISKPKIKEA